VLPPVDVDDPSLFSAMAQRCDTDWRTGTPAGRRRAHLLLAQMLLHLEASLPPPCHTASSDHAMAMLARQVRENPSQRRSVQELAEEAGLSRSQLTRRFTRATGLSPEAFFIQARIDRGRHLLAETQLSLSAIAQSLGYCDTYYFCRQFKSITKQTPGQYRTGRTMR